MKGVPRVELARIPTPLEPLEPRVWIKRDDLTGAALSGNKVRKLEFLLADALDKAAPAVVTCGGVNSNHARATAVACARLGLECHLVLRGEDRQPPTGNLLLSRFAGATTQFITHAQWPHVHEIMAEAAEARSAYVVPEGGSNGLGAMGYLAATKEMLAQTGPDVRRIVHAVGSGGTTAGLALGVASAGRADIEVVGVCVCDDAATFDTKIQSIIDDAADRGLVPHRAAEAARWRIKDGYIGPGYAETTPEAMERLRAITRSTGLFFDPVYTGKAFLALHDLPPLPEGDTVFVHTGGIFELFAFADHVPSN